MHTQAVCNTSSNVPFQKELVLQAVQKDQEGERSAALSLYCAAVEHFVPAIHCKNTNNLFFVLFVAQTHSNALHRNHVTNQAHEVCFLLYLLADEVDRQRKETLRQKVILKTRHTGITIFNRVCFEHYRSFH